MPREINEEQLVRVLVQINRIIGFGSSTGQEGQYPQATSGLWSKEIVQRWEGDFPRLLSMATAGNFSEALDALHQELKEFQRDPK